MCCPDMNWGLEPGCNLALRSRIMTSMSELLGFGGTFGLWAVKSSNGFSLVIHHFPFDTTHCSASSLLAISLSDFSADAWPLSCTFPSCCCVLPYDSSHIAFLGILGSCSICFMATLFGFFVATVSGELGGCSGLNKHWILSCLHLRQRVSL